MDNGPPLRGLPTSPENGSINSCALNSTHPIQPQRSNRAQPSERRPIEPKTNADRTPCLIIAAHGFRGSTPSAPNAGRSARANLPGSRANPGPPMQSETLQATEAYSAARSTHPRVSLADMEGKIDRAHYFTADQAVCAAENKVSYPGDPLAILTVCILVMANGFTIIGKSAPASPENFDPEKGKRFAYEDAIKQLWPLEGYALRERLAEQSSMVQAA